ncbi:ribosome biogenesis GTPase Der [Candidatus Nanogingivalis gingivitcus]|jgi:ribosome-associated GTPase engA|uniref:GTPase Der n=1 Tax=Candidatus Nanogingivalis gingivitcus TaxID=2171992 RepID=A0ABY0FIH1_9BACT|nr:ribosome biogenesis GTPase Der [Candidatus Nanogingivalis gingivitcus]RYC72731.1 GTPase Der [Candidatus Nanogingivalis gingivitcus]
MSKILPKVAIIGQANVGKSSLFNRMIRAQQAVVAREAGTTRDSVLGKVKYKKQAFWLIDTAGLKDPNDEFEATIQEQIQDAVDVSDLILVVLDSTKSFTHEDKLIAKKALKSRKPVFLVLNKTDLKGNLPNEEFLRLGIKPIFRTSAEHNSGVEDLLSEIADNIPKVREEAEENEDVIKVALVGRPNAGKSYLFNTLAGKQQAIVANVAGTTRDTNKTEIRFHDRTIELVDTAGMRKPGKQEVGIEKFSVLRTLNAIDEADICLLLMDANELNTQLDQRIAGLINDAGKGMIIVVSKWDSVEGKDAYTRDALAPRIAHYFKFTPWAPLIFTSSKTGQNVTKIFDLVLNVDRNRKRQAKTSTLNQLLQQATQSHPPAGLKNTHPKLRYISQSDSNPPWFIIHGSNLKFVHWSYKRYLERLIRENFDYSGTPIKFSFRDEKQIKENKKRIAEGKDPINKASGSLKKAVELQSKRERKRDERLAKYGITKNKK